VGATGLSSVVVARAGFGAAVMPIVATIPTAVDALSPAAARRLRAAA
jgi:hypothetical protein